MLLQATPQKVAAKFLGDGGGSRKSQLMFKGKYAAKLKFLKWEKGQSSATVQYIL